MKRPFALLLAVSLFLPTFVSAAPSHEGRLFIQVDSKGEAWYVNPTDHKRYPLRETDGFQVMSLAAIKISQEELRQIPLGVSDKQDRLLPSYSRLPDADQDLLPDFFEEQIGTEAGDSDSDDDGYLDGEEVRSGYDPLQPKIKGKLNNRVFGKYVGRFVHDSDGYLWYINPTTQRRYWIMNAFTGLDLVRLFGRGIRTRELQRIPNRVLPQPQRTASKTVSTGTVRQCGEAALEPSSSCWDESFRACVPAEATASIDFGPFGGIVQMRYTILGVQGNGCSVRAIYLTNPNPEFLQKEITCRLNPERSFTSELQQALQTGEACTGPLKPLLVNLN